VPNATITSLERHWRIKREFIYFDLPVKPAFIRSDRDFSNDLNYWILATGQWVSKWVIKKKEKVDRGSVVNFSKDLVQKLSGR
jgi:hypothetical protein